MKSSYCCWCCWLLERLLSRLGSCLAWAIPETIDRGEAALILMRL